jgi:adenosylhomocysteine nucleosidase
MSKCFLVALQEELSGLKEINGIPIIYCGVGKINASIGTFNAIKMGFDEIINIGSCGSKNYKVGEVIKIGKVFQDIDSSPISEYGITPFENDSEYIEISDSNESCFTTDYFYDKNQINKYSPKYLEMINKCSVFDMESYSIAKICRIFDIKYNSYKWVSDDGNHSDWLNNCKLGFENLIKNYNI